MYYFVWGFDLMSPTDKATPIRIGTQRFENSFQIIFASTETRFKPGTNS